MECFCASEKKEKSTPGPADECDHSFCITQRQKKQCGCVDLPPKGLPWSTGLLKYIPGQRKIYKDLVLNAPAEQEEPKKDCPQLCKPPKPNGADTNCACCCGGQKNNTNNLGGKKKKKKKSKSKRGNVRSGPSYMSHQSQGRNNNGCPGAQPPCCIELEEVYVCDGSSPEPRKGFLVRPCQRPEVVQAVDVAESEMAKLAEDEDAQADTGMVCLCIPRAYLKKYKGPQEDLCAPPCPPPQKKNEEVGEEEEEAQPLE